MRNKLFNISVIVFTIFCEIVFISNLIHGRFWAAGATIVLYIYGILLFTMLKNEG